MNRQQFNSNNKVGQTFTFQKSGSTASFTPSITIGGSKRVSYNFGDGIQTAGNSVTYLGFSSDTSIRTITVKTNKIKDITALNFFNDNVYGNLNLTGLTSLGGVFSVALNSKLTGITNPISSSVFTNYECWGCDITGQLDLSTLTGLGGNVSLQDNLNLTGVTFPNTNTLFNRLTIYQSNLIGNLNLTGLTALGGNFGVFTNPNLTGITHGPTSQTFTNYEVYNCNLIGTLDLSTLVNLGGSSSGLTVGVVKTYSNSGITNIIFPNSSKFFKNDSNFESGGAFSLYGCNLDYIDFKTLSGATLVSGVTQGVPIISLRDNGMIADDVNHILVDFSGNATYNPTGWSNINLNIGGTNADPDSSSGGYDGLAAISFLTGSPYNWTITY
jgi:hypothetical protein